MMAITYIINIIKHNKFMFSIFILVIIGISSLLRTFQENKDWIADVPIPTTSSLDADLFSNLVDAGLVWAERENSFVAIQYIPCNTATLLAPTATSALPPPAAHSSERLVQELCNSAQGIHIRDSIDQFNRSFLISGISDNREASAAGNTSDGIPCAEAGLTAKFFVPPGCFPNQWLAFLARDGRPAQLAPSSSITPVEYAMLAVDNVPYFGDWMAISPFLNSTTGKAENYLYRSDVVLGSRPLFVRAIGALNAITVNGVNVPFPTGSLHTQKLLANGETFEISTTTVCARQGNKAIGGTPCSAPLEVGEPMGSTITIKGPVGALARIAIEIQPHPVAPLKLRTYAHRREQAGTAERQVIGTGRIRMSCTPLAPKLNFRLKGDKATGCDLSWNIPQDREAPQGSITRVEISASGTNLFNANGSLTDHAFDMGLGSLVGLGVGDPGSLALSLKHAKSVAAIDLTIDPELQTIAQNIVTTRYSELAEEDHCSLANACERRVDLVIMDAEEKTAGEILALASWPQAAIGLSLWDINTLERVSPGRSPVSAYPWHNYDVRATPGSTFKIVTALAASQKALDTSDPKLIEYLLGSHDKAGMAAWLGVKAATSSSFQGNCELARKTGDLDQLNALPVPDANGHQMYCIGNSSTSRWGGHVPFGPMFQSGATTGCNENDSSNRAGLCEALKDSSNLYFSGLALQLDQSAFLSPGTSREHGKKVTTFYLARMADRLFPSKWSREEAQKRGPLDILDVNYPYSGRARASPLVVEAAEMQGPGQPRRFQLARAGIGLSVQASPLAMTTVAASVATGTIVRPHVIPIALRGEKTDPIEGQPILLAEPNVESQKLRDALIAQIRLGMSAVVQSGTASEKMRILPSDLRRHVFAKTGTAPLNPTKKSAPKEGLYAAWLIGYVEPPGGKSGIKRRLAFACRVARTNQFGGPACGPIISNLLLTLHGMTP